MSKKYKVEISLGGRAYMHVEGTSKGDAYAQADDAKMKSDLEKKLSAVMIAAGFKEVQFSIWPLKSGVDLKK